MRQRWQMKREMVSHTDDWLMTYADMITLLLCFFAIFLSISIPRKDVPKTMVMAQTVPVAAPPADFLEGNLPFHGLIHADQATEEEPAEQTPATVAPPPAPIKPTPVKADAPPVAAVKPPSSPAAVTPPRPASLPEIVAKLKAQGPAALEQKGDRITTLEISSAAFFDSGSATVSDAGEAILRNVSVNLKSDKFRDYEITVEGHTDDTPIHTPQFPSNWELSTARAAAVVHFLLDQGIPAQKLRAAGYADTFPKVPNRDADGNAIPENQALNRRVVIKLEKIEKADAAAPASTSP